MTTDGHRDSYRPPFYGIPFAVVAAVLGTAVGGMLLVSSVNDVLALLAAVVVFLLAYWNIRDWDRRKA